METDEQNEAILKALDGAKDGLDVDSVIAVMALTRTIEVENGFVNLLKEGKITARYNGDKTKDVDPDMFVYLKVDIENKTGDK
jgi:hypothetical protein